MMLVYQAIEELMKADPLATLVVPSGDHEYREVNLFTSQSEEDGNGDLHEYHGEEYQVDPERGEVIPIVVAK